MLSCTEAFAYKMFHRYHDDDIFRAKIDKLVNDLYGYTIRLIQTDECIVFDGDISYSKLVDILGIDVTKIVSCLKAESVIENRYKTHYSERIILRAILANYCYITLTSFSMGIRIKEEKYDGLYLEIVKKVRVVISQKEVYTAILNNKDLLIEVSSKNEDIKFSNRHGVNMVNGKELNSYANNMYLLIRKEIGNSESRSVIIGLMTLLTVKGAATKFTNWASYGILLAWCRLNLKERK